LDKDLLVLGAFLSTPISTADKRGKILRFALLSRGTGLAQGKRERMPKDKVLSQSTLGYLYTVAPVYNLHLMEKHVKL